MLLHRAIKLYIYISSSTVEPNCQWVIWSTACSKLLSEPLIARLCYWYQLLVIGSHILCWCTLYCWQVEVELPRSIPSSSCEPALTLWHRTLGAIFTSDPLSNAPHRGEEQQNWKLKIRLYIILQTNTSHPIRRLGRLNGHDAVTVECDLSDLFDEFKIHRNIITLNLILFLIGIRFSVLKLTLKHQSCLRFRLRITWPEPKNEN